MRAFHILMGVIVAGIFASFIPLLAKDKPAVKQSLRQQLSRCGSGVGARAVAGDRIALISGEEVVMAAIHAPHVTYTADGKISVADSQPYGIAAQERLDQLIKGQKLAFYCEGRRQDYRGRRVAHIFTGKAAKPLSLTLVDEGLVWVYPSARQGKILPDLYKKEWQAQEKGRGLWSVDGPLLAKYGYPRLYQGRVVAVRHQGPWLYLKLQKLNGNKGKALTVAVAVKYKKRLLARLPRAAVPTLDDFLGQKIGFKIWTERDAHGQSETGALAQKKSDTLVITVPERIYVGPET